MITKIVQQCQNRNTYYGKLYNKEYYYIMV